MKKKELLSSKVEHIDIKKVDTTALVKQFGATAFQAKNLARAADIWDRMLQDKKCTVILCLAGSLFSAGLRRVVHDMVESRMVDAIVSTGAIIVDQDFFEGLGFRHYQGSPLADDEVLQKQGVDRIYDTFIDEDELRECDMTVKAIADGLEPGA